jgi:hypothetical protein
MSDTEVTVTKSVSGNWYRMEYRGKVEFCDEAPSADEQRAFRTSIDRLAREARQNAIAAKRMRDRESTLHEEEFRR